MLLLARLLATLLFYSLTSSRPISLIKDAKCLQVPVMGSSTQHQDVPTTTTDMTNQTVYFGFGSNLWLHQMSLRCPTSQYIGIARLNGYRWIINDRGYANVVEISHKSTSHDQAEQPADSDSATNHDAVVYGLVYTLQPEDEARLDKNEGVPIAYTKEHLPCSLWAVPEPGIPSWRDVTKSPNQTSNMLVYIDRNRTSEDEPKTEYIYRMNRGIDDAVEMGMPKDYVKNVLRKFIPSDEEAGGQTDEKRNRALRQAQRFEDESGIFRRTD